MKNYFALVLLCLALGEIAAQVDEKCLSCLRQYEDGPIDSCYKSFGTKIACGVFHISKPFWVACGSIGYNWERCTQDEFCAGKCIQNFFRKFASRCAHQLKKPVSELTCADYVRLHHGPDGCSMSSSLRHSRAINNCMWQDNMFGKKK
ncbi:hypothetical protein EB796_008545 [Bugula neritina]|uniref:lysozyme n=1 Tax=Bugula neritina TaxID=10212 RepID=A0A7J7K4N2_BUGNE|nr:hypothetical protein EB796_008545 [Bugula neritina]